MKGTFCQQTQNPITSHPGLSCIKVLKTEEEKGWHGHWDCGELIQFQHV